MPERRRRSRVAGRARPAKTPRALRRPPGASATSASPRDRVGDPALAFGVSSSTVRASSSAASASSRRPRAIARSAVRQSVAHEPPRSPARRNMSRASASCRSALVVVARGRVDQAEPGEHERRRRAGRAAAAQLERALESSRAPPRRCLRRARGMRDARARRPATLVVRRAEPLARLVEQARARARSPRSARRSAGSRARSRPRRARDLDERLQRLLEDDRSPGVAGRWRGSRRC